MEYFQTQTAASEGQYHSTDLFYTGFSRQKNHVSHFLYTDLDLDYMYLINLSVSWVRLALFSSQEVKFYWSYLWSCMLFSTLLRHTKTLKTYTHTHTCANTHFIGKSRASRWKHSREQIGSRNLSLVHNKLKSNFKNKTRARIKPRVHRWHTEKYKVHLFLYTSERTVWVFHSEAASENESTLSAMSQILSDHFQITTCYWTTHLILLSDSYMKLWLCQAFTVM